MTRIYLKDLCARHNVQWLWDSVSLVITLRHEDRQAKALMGSDVVILGTEKILLSAPVVQQRSTIIVPPDFKKKIIDRLVEKPTVFVPPRRIYKVIIDAGHGGKDPGSIGKTGFFEKTVVLDISRRLQENLEHKRFTVEMTRRKDEFISLAKRTEITSRSSADLFISIHANSSPVQSVHGVEAFCPRAPENEKQEKSQFWKNRRILFNSLTMKKNYPELENILGDMLYRYKRAKSWIAASYIVKGICRKVKTKNRGTKKSGFFVLRNTLIPAVLVEVGFLSNRREESLLKTSSYRQKIADALAESIVQYADRYP